MTLARAHPAGADGAWMEEALALAALGDGATRPNPRVGCVVVRAGRAVGWGYHREAGGPHAEAIALERAGRASAGATLYVNLEPCAHHGRTPPCADLLVARGIARVVASITDPNPKVNGSGFRRLREAGVAVEVGLLEQRARALNEPFLRSIATARPLVTAKAAISLDGQIAASRGRSRWISGKPARRFAHRLRMSADALLVGAGTVRADDPRLTVRLPGIDAPRLRVVLAPGLDVDPRARIFERGSDREPRARIYAARETPAARASRFAALADVVFVATRDGMLDLEAVLDDLGALGVQSLLLEGGGRTVASFLDANLVQRVALFVAPRLIGAQGATPLVDRLAAASPDRGQRVVPERVVPLGDDLLVLGRIAHGAA